MTSAERIVLKGGRVVDSRGERVADVAVQGGVVVEVGEQLSSGRTIDASGCVVAPGFVDLHAHLREPGKEEAETIETGSRAGAKGGYTALVAMPNTDPPQDSVAVIDFVREQGKRAGLVEVVPSGCITLGRQGETLAPMAELAAAGVRVITQCRIESLSERHLTVKIGQAASKQLPIGQVLIFANGPRSNIDVVAALEQAGVPYARVGECHAPGDFLSAIRDGWMVALGIDQQPFSGRTV